MKIVFLSFYSGEVYRGVETYVHCLANELVKLGHEVTVYQNGPKLQNSLYKNVSLSLQIDYTKKKNYTPYLNYYSLLIRKFTKIALSKIDHDTNIIFPTNGQWQSLLCKFWAKKHKAKLVISGQSGPGMDDRLNVSVLPDTFVSLTEFQYKWAKKINSKVKGVIIPNGVDIKEFSGSVKPYNFNLPKPIILSVAAFDKWKRLDLAINAVSKLQSGSLVLVGKGEEEQRLRKLGEKLLSNRFKILSFPHNEMPKVFKGANVFTFPTVPWESFGIVLVEAMAAGLPIVASDDPIRREIVGDAGLFVDPTDSTAYAQAIEKALTIDWKDEQKKQAEKFGWDRIAREYEELFAQLVKSSK